jgi:hypothetical protein
LQYKTELNNAVFFLINIFFIIYFFSREELKR